ncbi:MAG TPA: phosphotransferase [Candidatus Limnocylindria bacterium]|nr:phosphotransferase [Candidatus Limnocylindria bacterium]
MSSEIDLPWQRPEWRDEALAWIREQVARLGWRVTGSIEQPHVIWWSSVFRVPTSDGVVWFKAVQPDGAFEARLTPLLAADWPQHTAHILATDAERGWTLARDAGARMRELDDGRAVVEHWERLLPRYAEVQLGMADRRDELLRLGVPDRGLKSLPHELRAALDEPRVLLIGQEDGLDEADRDALVAGLEEFSELCATLAEMGIPESIQHDDLHDGNAFLRDGEYVFFDWGDACVSHPFHTLVVTLRALAYRQRWEPGGPEVMRLLSAYLEPWTRLVPSEQVLAAADMARRTGTIQRAMAWRDYTAVMPPAVAAENVDSVPYGLRMYLLNAPWGSWDDGTF